MQVLVKRIQIAEEEASGSIAPKELIKKWFPAKVYGQDICTYILDHTWHKPRDIVRLLLSAQQSGAKNEECFTQNAFDTFLPKYSAGCLAEIREELQALYSQNELDEIFRCFEGFRVSFTFEELCERVKRLKPDSFFAGNIDKVLIDLYRVGFLGNQYPSQPTTEWAYKGEGEKHLKVDFPWQIVVHPALYQALSISGRKDNWRRRNQRMQSASGYNGATNAGIDDRIPETGLASSSTEVTFNSTSLIYQAVVQSIETYGLVVSFEKDGAQVTGYIPSSFSGLKAAQSGPLERYFSLGENVSVKIVRYAAGHGRWILSVIKSDD